MFDWQQYLEIATDLLTHPPEAVEAGYRTAASRAYYAAFHRSRETIESERGAKLGQQSIHSEVLRYFQGRPGREEVAQSLERLLNKRRHADYNGHRPFPPEEAQLALELARRVLSGLG
jgi:uncharacterized protein (UPF0332 family)